jgi:DNA-binding PadR family transcriptional regulator
LWIAGVSPAFSIDSLYYIAVQMELANSRKVRMAKKPSNYIGEFEELVLLAILNQGDNAYGVTIREALEEATNRSITVGSLYTTLSRLEEKGLVESWVGEPTAERGGRAKKHYKVKGSAQSLLKEVQCARQRLMKAETVGSVA